MGFYSEAVCSRLQSHLTKSLSFVTEEDAALTKLQTVAENSVGIHKQLVSVCCDC